MRIIRNIFSLCDKLLGFFITFIAVVMFLFSGYVLYDNFYKGKMAFSSFDLQQYKPLLKEISLGFADILELNPDTVAWLTINDTNIDYPVLQGDNDLEYINKDNGAMFGNIENYFDDDFFNSHRDGILMSPGQNFDIKIFAAMKTDAYNDLIYFKNIDSDRMHGEITKYIEKRHRLCQNNCLFNLYRLPDKRQSGCFCRAFSPAGSNSRGQG